MAVGLVVVIIVTNTLVTIESTKGVLLGDIPIETSGETRLLQAPGIEEFHVSIRRNGQLLLTILHLQTAAEHILTLT